MFMKKSGESFNFGLSSDRTKKLWNVMLFVLVICIILFQWFVIAKYTGEIEVEDSGYYYLTLFAIALLLGLFISQKSFKWWFSAFMIGQLLLLVVYAIGGGSLNLWPISIVFLAIVSLILSILSLAGAYLKSKIIDLLR